MWLASGWVGVVAALRTDEAGAVWRLAEDLPSLGADAEVYVEHLAGGVGRATIADGPNPLWAVGDESPHEPHPEMAEVAAQVREDLTLMQQEPPEVVEAIMTARGNGS